MHKNTTKPFVAEFQPQLEELLQLLDFYPFLLIVSCMYLVFIAYLGLIWRVYSMNRKKGIVTMKPGVTVFPNVFHPCSIYRE